MTADDSYLRESILKPEAKIVDGFDDVMPKPELTDEELNADHRISEDAEIDDHGIA